MNITILLYDDSNIKNINTNRIIVKVDLKYKFFYFLLSQYFLINLYKDIKELQV